MLDAFIKEQQFERNLNTISLAVRAAFLTWVVWDLVVIDRGWSQVLDLVFILLWGVWTWFGFRKDRRILATIKQAELQKEEWEQKKKTLGGFG